MADNNKPFNPWTDAEPVRYSPRFNLNTGYACIAIPRDVLEREGDVERGAIRGYYVVGLTKTTWDIADGAGMLVDGPNYWLLLKEVDGLDSLEAVVGLTIDGMKRVNAAYGGNRAYIHLGLTSHADHDEVRRLCVNPLSLASFATSRLGQAVQDYIASLPVKS